MIIDEILDNLKKSRYGKAATEILTAEVGGLVGPGEGGWVGALLGAEVGELVGAFEGADVGAETGGEVGAFVGA